MDFFRDRNVRAWVFIVGVLLILAWMAFTVISLIQDTTRRAQEAVQPVTDLSHSVGTQVAQFLRPTPTVYVDPIAIVHQVRSLARLETIQYSVERVITAERGQDVFGRLFGDRLLFVAHGVVIAGVDLQKLGPDDLQVRNNVLYVKLPEPEIFVATLDNERSYVYDRDTGLLTRGDIHLETTARRTAEQAIRAAALEDGILEQARTNAENYLYRLLMEIGNYAEVIFERPTPQP